MPMGTLRWFPYRVEHTGLRGLVRGLPLRRGRLREGPSASDTNACKEQQSGRWDAVSPKEPRTCTWPPSMKAADLPPVITGHKPICTPTRGACLEKGAVRDGRKWAEKERLLG